jgi:hypothetical protein
VAGWSSCGLAVPGAFIDRSAGRSAGPTMSAPMSQSEVSLVCPSAFCLTWMPKTSETDSLSAPDCPE